MNPRPSFPRRQAGVGSLVIVVLVLLLAVAVMGLGQSFFSSHLIDKAQRSSLGGVALALAESAVQEALLSVQLLVNDPASQIYKKFREPTDAQGDDGFSISVPGNPASQPPLPATQRLLARPELGGYTLEPMLIDVCFRRPVNSISYETSGLLRFSAKVSSDRMGSVVRGVDLYKDFRVNLVCPPRPFDQVSFFLNEPDSLLGSPVAEANDRIKTAYERLQQFVKEVLPKAKQQVRDAGGSSTVEKAIDDCLAKLGAWVPPSIEKPPGDDNVWTHYFKDPLLVLSIVDLPDLATLDLRARLQSSRDALKAAEDAISAKAEALSKASSISEGEPRTIELVEAINGAGTLYRARLELYREFQKAFFEKAGPDYQKWQEQFLPKLEPDRWKQKASFVVESQRQFDELHSRLGNRLNGVVYAKCGLEVPPAWKGKAVLVAEGPVELKDVALEDRSKDQLTVLGFSEIRVTGAKCEAAILCGPAADLTIAGPVKFYGQLVFSGRVRRPEELKGQLEKNRYLFSGYSEDPQPKIDHLMVSISPQVRFRGVYRR